MRAPSDMPSRPPRSPSSNRGRIGLIVVAVALFFLITSLRGIAGFYTDFLWFDSLGQADVWKGVLGAKVALATIFTVGFFALLWINLFIADRVAPPFRASGPEEEFIERYQDLIGGRTGLVRVLVAGGLALIAGPAVSSEWNSWLLFLHGGDFGVDDPQFGVDVGFYVFKLPFLSFLVSWLFAALLIVLIVTTVAHYLNGGIRMSAPRQRVTPQVKAHLSVLLALLALVKGAGYWLARYELTLSTRGFVNGASYTDVKAQLPATNLLILIMLASVVLFIVNIWRRGWTLPVVGVGLWALIAVIAGAIYPQFIQRFTVDPNEPELEQPYIARNLEATAAAMNLQDVMSEPYELETDKANIDLRANEATVKNIRIWDPSPAILGKTFNQLQKVKDYYAVNNVDVDRYELDGVPTQVVLAVRDLNTKGVPPTSWAARHLTYTHGYGAIVAPANAADANGNPVFVGRDVPHQSDAPELDLTQPAVYFGENLTDYVVVGSKQRELNYQDDDSTKYAAYEGKDGVKLEGFVRQAAFALRFGDPNPLISDQLTSSSRVLYQRDIKDRVETLAPFLTYDSDPYPVIVDGRIQWIIDAYTTTSRYPYAQQVDVGGSQLGQGSGLDRTFNYVRNSVKAVVDAYDGTVTFYVMPGDDPIIEAYRDAFPKLFTDFDEMPDDLRSHLRYPEDLFRVQTSVWAKYHVGSATDFYQGNDFWDVARDAGTTTAAGESSSAATSPSTTTDAEGNVIRAKDKRTDPYYVFTELPGEEQAEFVLMRPFVPITADDDNQLLTAFMVARSDGENYGELQVYVMPRADLPDGPSNVQGQIQSTPAVGEQETLLSGSGSRVSYGTLVPIPIDNGLVYVRPFYVSSTQTDIPGIAKVIVEFEGEVAIADTLESALTIIFRDSPPTLEEPGGEDPDPEGPVISGTIPEQVTQLLQEANDLFQQADDALPDFEAYAELTREARAKIAQAERLLTSDAGEEPTPTTTTSTTVAAASA